MSSIINSSKDGPFVFDPSGPTGNEFEVYGYRGKDGEVEILEEGTFVTAYDFPLNGTSVLLVVVHLFCWLCTEHWHVKTKRSP